MSINPSEVTKLLKDQIKNFGEKAEVSEIGKVLSVGDGIARVYGLDNVQAGEMVEFSDGSKGEVSDTYPQYVKYTCFGLLCGHCTPPLGGALKDVFLT